MAAGFLVFRSQSHCVRLAAQDNTGIKCRSKAAYADGYEVQTLDSVGITQGIVAVLNPDESARRMLLCFFDHLR